jgi:hypothetical protein
MVLLLLGQVFLAVILGGEVGALRGGVLPVRLEELADQIGGLVRVAHGGAYISPMARISSARAPGFERSGPDGGTGSERGRGGLWGSATYRGSPGSPRTSSDRNTATRARPGRGSGRTPLAAAPGGCPASQHVLGLAHQVLALAHLFGLAGAAERPPGRPRRSWRPEGACTCREPRRDSPFPCS